MIAHLPFNKHLFVKLIKVTDAKIDKPWYHVFTGALLGGDLLWSSLRYGLKYCFDFSVSHILGL